MRVIVFVALTLASTTAAAQSWERGEVRGASTRYEMPGHPEVQQSVASTDHGLRLHRITHSCAWRRSHFTVYVAAPEGGTVSDPVHLADWLLEPVLAGFAYGPAQRTRHRRLSLPGFFADALRYEQEGATLYVRRAVGRERVYIALAWVRDRASARLAGRFMRSLEPDPADALFPVVDGVAERWEPVFVPHEELAVRMPTPSRDALDRVELPGLRAPARTIEARTAAAVYRVRIVHVPWDAPVDLAAILAAWSIEGEPTPVHANGYAGWERTADDGRLSRAYRTASRVVVLEVVPRAGALPSVSSDFFASLQLL